MSVQSLVDKYVPHDKVLHVTTRLEHLAELPCDGRTLVFVASLWSGKSQLAFREICSVLAQCGQAAISLFVLDGDEELPAEIRPIHLSASGNGCAIFFNGTALVASQTGKDLNAMRSMMIEFVADL